MRLVILRELQATQRKTCPFSSVSDFRDHFGELLTDLPPQWVRTGESAHEVKKAAGSWEDQLGQVRTWLKSLGDARR